MRNIRRAVQGIILLVFVFLFLQTDSKGNDQLGYPVKVFLDLDPLVFISTLISTRAGAWENLARGLFSPLALALIVISVTVLLGRVFCGWFCPLGTLNNMVSVLKIKSGKPPFKWFNLKYYLLLILLMASVFSLQWVGLADPMALLIRSSSLALYPAFNYGLREAFDALYQADIPVITGLSERAYDLARGGILSFDQPYFRQGVFIGLLFVGILGLNLVERRFWCRYLCPLGAMLGLLSGRALLRRSVSEGCTECGKCNTVCQGGAEPHVKGKWKGTECLYCYNCDDICPEAAVTFGFSGGRGVPVDLSRRKLVVSALAGAAAVPLLRTTPLAVASEPRLIRPPGALREGDFLTRCVKCGECMKVCITNGLQPTLFEAGLEGIWSPVLIPRYGYCEYRCTLCGQVCPTGAIRKLTLKEKTEVKIGLATINRNRCLPWAHATPCIVCEEVCPTPKKAIWLEKAESVDREGRRVELRRPRVDLELCVGCGICETKCPVVDMPAIYVTSIGESRSQKNRLLLI